MGLLDGKAAVVTGAASGIGFASASRLAEEGAQVVIGDLSVQAGERAASEIGGHFFELDVGDPDGWSHIVEVAQSKLGGVDIAHLNAGVTTGEPDLSKLTDDQYRRITRANIDGVVLGTRALIPAMERRGGGSIVATASLAGLIAFSPDPVYTLTKHAVVGLVRSLAPQLAEKNITINAVCPGMVDTPMLGEDARAVLIEAKFPLIPPRDIADAVLGCVTGSGTGDCFVCQAGREPVAYRFAGVPGPLAEGAVGRPPPSALAAYDQVERDG